MSRVSRTASEYLKHKWFLRGVNEWGLAWYCLNAMRTCEFRSRTFKETLHYRSNKLWSVFICGTNTPYTGLDSRSMSSSGGCGLQKKTHNWPIASQYTTNSKIWCIFRGISWVWLPIVGVVCRRSEDNLRNALTFEIAGVLFLCLMRKHITTTTRTVTRSSSSLVTTSKHWYKWCSRCACKQEKYIGLVMVLWTSCCPISMTITTLNSKGGDHSST